MIEIGIGRATKSGERSTSRQDRVDRSLTDDVSRMPFWRLHEQFLSKAVTKPLLYQVA